MTWVWLTQFRFILVQFDVVYGAIWLSKFFATSIILYIYTHRHTRTHIYNKALFGNSTHMLMNNSFD